MIKSALQSSLTNDVKYSSMSAGAVPSNEYLIATTILTQGEPSVTFDVSSLSQTYRHLRLQVVVRSNNSAVWEEMKLTFNGNNTGYRSHLLGGTGSSVFSAWSDVTTSYAKPWAFSVGNTATADVFGVATIDILDPFKTTKATSLKAFGGRMPANGETRVALSSAVWANTAAVTSITIAPEAGSQWLSKSRFSLYGVTA